MDTSILVIVGSREQSRVLGVEQSRHLRAGNIPTGSREAPHNSHHVWNRARVGEHPRQEDELQGNRDQYWHQRPAGKN